MSHPRTRPNTGRQPKRHLWLYVTGGALLCTVAWVLITNVVLLRSQLSGSTKQVQTPVRRSSHIPDRTPSVLSPQYQCPEQIWEEGLSRARFQVLTPHVIRMEFVSNKSVGFNDLATFTIVNRNVPCVQFEHSQSKHEITIETQFLKLTYRPDHKGFTSKNLQILIKSENTTWYPGMPNRHQRFGTIRTLDRASGAVNLDCQSHTHPQYSATDQHCARGVISLSGWTVLDDSLTPSFDNSDWPWLLELPEIKIRQDWYMFGHGLDYKQALRDYSLLAGKQPIPPKFAFGVFYSKWWPWADWESMNIIREYDQHAVPLDVFVTDMDWHTTCYDNENLDLAGEPSCWTGWTWDPKYFPDPKQFLDWCRQHGIKNTLNLHFASGVQPTEARFLELAEAMGIDASKPTAYVPWNVTDKRFSELFHKIVLKPIEEQGIDFWWLDWQQGENWFEDTFPNANPTFYLNYVFFTQPARWGSGDRPLILHRWGGLGSHRYPVGFSGDVYPNWESLAFQPFMTSEAANVLFGYWSHDIGGFMEPAGDELYLRWIQYGVFSPIFRTHGTRMAENWKKMWHFKPEYFKAMRSAMQLRSKLTPYIYTAARYAYDSGISICSPLYYEYPILPEAYMFKTQYMFGKDLMVAPVVGPVSEKTRLIEHMEIWIPPGEWIEVWSGKVFVGPKTVKRSFGITEIPYYARGGAVVIQKLVGEEEKVLHGWLGRAAEIGVGLEMNIYLPLDIDSGVSGHALHYEDDGHSIQYTQGRFTTREFSYHITPKQMVVNIEAPEGSFPSMASKQYYRIIIHGSAPATRVMFDSGAPIAYRPWALFDPSQNVSTWHYNGGLVATVINLYHWIPATDRVSIVIDFTPPLTSAIRNQLNGLKGRISRSQIVKSTLDATYPETVPSDYEMVTRYAETGLRLSYHPERFATELDSEVANFKSAKEHVRRFKKFERSNAAQIAVAHLGARDTKKSENNKQ